ncbi:MAG: DUF5131 family protein [Dehalococcoidia bacterium]
MATGIEWTDETWNPTTGCTPVSPGCDHCYAEIMAKRLQRFGQHKYRNGFAYTEHEQELDRPHGWTKPRRIFVNSMSDLFHEEATQPFIFRVFDVMREVDRHTYQVLTKRPNKAAAWLRIYCIERGLQMLPPHIWIGTSVENQDAVYRVGHLLRVPAAVQFLSCEPLLGPLDLSRLRLFKDSSYFNALDGFRHIDIGNWTKRLNDEPEPRVHWVIAGCESGQGMRPCDDDWLRSLRDQCVAAGIPFFLKQKHERVEETVHVTDITGPRRDYTKVRSRLVVKHAPELDGRQWLEVPQREEVTA